MESRLLFGTKDAFRAENVDLSLTQGLQKTNMVNGERVFKDLNIGNIAMYCKIHDGLS